MVAADQATVEVEGAVVLEGAGEDVELAAGSHVDIAVIPLKAAAGELEVAAALGDQAVVGE